MPKKYQRRNLVVLMFADNTCYTILSELNSSESSDVRKMSGLEVDVKKGTWSYVTKMDRWENIAIGQGRSLYGSNGKSKYGVIGVYDRTRIEHLKAMNYHSTEATRPEPSPLED